MLVQDDSGLFRMVQGGIDPILFQNNESYRFYTSTIRYTSFVVVQYGSAYLGINSMDCTNPF